MKLNAIGLATACSLLSVAFCQPIEAKTIRGDNGSGGAWNEGNPSTGGPALVDPIFSAPGLTLSEVGFVSTSAQTDIANVSLGEGGLGISSGTMYNWYLSSTVSSGVPEFPQAIQAQMIVYALDGPNTATDTATGGTYDIANNDFEVQVNYCATGGGFCPGSTTGSTVSASFTFGGSTYSSVANEGPPDADFLFSSSGTFLGTLLVDDNPSDATFGAVDFTPSTASNISGWTSSAVGTTAAPEIDSSSMITALTLLTGALMIVRGNTRSRARVVANG